MDSVTPVMKYCPKCGIKALVPHEGYGFQCGSCGFKFYLNVASAAAAIIIDKQNRLLVTIRAKDPAKDTFDLPGGFVDPDETAEQAVRREIKEELNLDITQTKYLYSIPNEYPFMGIVYRTLDLIFLCAIDDLSSARAMDDVKGIEWMPIQNLDPGSFGLKSIRQVIQKLKESSKG